MNAPPLDLHAHVGTEISREDLLRLGAVVFVATRSLEETSDALRRDDMTAVWGVGVHPAVGAAHTAFNRQRFIELASRTAFVSEVGLDGSVNVPFEAQRRTFTSILGCVHELPRIISIHSYRACTEVLDCLSDTPIRGAILHWWLGDPDETARAVELGCWFSVNPASARRGLPAGVPLERLLTETDHPFGDRVNRSAARPGNVAAVEQAIAKHHGVGVSSVREHVWSNLAELVAEAGCASLLPRPVRLQLLAARPRG